LSSRCPANCSCKQCGNSLACGTSCSPRAVVGEAQVAIADHLRGDLDSYCIRRGFNRVQASKGSCMVFLPSPACKGSIRIRSGSENKICIAQGSWVGYELGHSHGERPNLPSGSACKPSRGEVGFIILSCSFLLGKLRSIQWQSFSAIQMHCSDACSSSQAMFCWVWMKVYAALGSIGEEASNHDVVLVSDESDTGD